MAGVRTGISIFQRAGKKAESCRDPEIRLAADLARGNSRSIELFLSRYSREIYHFAYRFLGNAEDARDAAQQSLLKALEHVGQFDPHKGRMRSWLLKITANHCLNELKKRTRAIQRESSIDDDHLANRQQSESPLTEEFLSVRQALGELSPGDRQIVILAYYHGLTYQEIGTVLGLRLGTVKSRLSRAINRLREKFA